VKQGVEITRDQTVPCSMCGGDAMSPECNRDQLIESLPACSLHHEPMSATSRALKSLRLAYNPSCVVLRPTARSPFAPASTTKTAMCLNTALTSTTSAPQLSQQGGTDSAAQIWLFEPSTPIIVGRVSSAHSSKQRQLHIWKRTQRPPPLRFTSCCLLQAWHRTVALGRPKGLWL
jgi:hypothetical protein